MDIRRQLVLSTLALLLLAGAAQASDPVGIYALIEKVTLEPGAEKPERIRIDGAFAIAGGKRGGLYTGPRWGYLYFKLQPGKEAQCLKEWNDLKTLAGKVAGIGARYEMKDVKLRSSAAKAENPDLYPLGWGGVSKVRNSKYNPVAQLQAFPKPLSPVGEAVHASTSPRGQTVTLTAKNAADNPDGTKYLFELESPSTGIHSSGLIKPGEDGRTSWSVRVRLTPGEKLTWRVRVVREGLSKVAVAVTTVPIQAAKDE